MVYKYLYHKNGNNNWKQIKTHNDRKRSWSNANKVIDFKVLSVLEHS